MNLNDKLVLVRQNNGLSQLALSKMINMSETNYVSIENGKTAVLVKNLLKLSNSFNLPVDYLLAEEDLEFSYFTIESFLHQLKSNDIVHIIELLQEYIITINEIDNVTKLNYRTNLNKNNNYKLLKYDILYKEDIEKFIKKNISMKISRYRKKMKVTQQIFSERINKSINFVKSLESGRAIPSLNTFKDICIEMKVPAFCMLQSDNEAFYYSNREMYDKIRTLDESSLKKIIAALDAINNN